jgi:DNA-binding NtrC family response regulator
MWYVCLTRPIYRGTMAKKLRVLHLEDDAGDAFFVRNVLEQNGFNLEIILARSEEEFRSALAKDALDVILSDSGVPGFSGDRALELASKLSPQTPFIFVSGAADKKQAGESLETGAADFVPKGQLWQLPVAIRRHTVGS